MHPSVLIVDDDEDSLVILATALSASGFDVKTARSCAEARATLERGDLDALVADFSLDDGTAVDLVESLGERRPRFSILLTGFGDAAHRAAGKAAGFRAYLVKPVPLELLEKTLRAELGPTALPAV